MRCGPILLLSSALVASGVRADSLQLKPVADTAIFSSQPQNNFGRQNSLPLGTINKTADFGRMLLRFDLSLLPAGAVVTNASLRVTVAKERFGGPAVRIGAHRLLRSWGEGAKSGQTGAAAAAGEATWLDRLKGQAAWEAPGAKAGSDFTSASSATANLDGPANYTFASSPALVADVQAWLQTPADNFGWLLLSQQENVQGNAKRVASRENSAQAPVLTVQFTPPPPPPKFDRIALNGGAVELGFRALAGNIYALSFRDEIAAGVWQPLTNVTSKLQDADAVVTDPATTAARFYQMTISGQVD